MDFTLLIQFLESNSRMFDLMTYNLVLLTSNLNFVHLGPLWSGMKMLYHWLSMLLTDFVIFLLYYVTLSTFNSIHPFFISLLSLFLYLYIFESWGFNPLLKILWLRVMYESMVEIQPFFLFTIPFFWWVAHWLHRESNKFDLIFKLWDLSMRWHANGLQPCLCPQKILC